MENLSGHYIAPEEIPDQEDEEWLQKIAAEDAAAADVEAEIPNDEDEAWLAEIAQERWSHDSRSKDRENTANQGAQQYGAREHQQVEQQAPSVAPNLQEDAYEEQNEASERFEGPFCRAIDAGGYAFPVIGSRGKMVYATVATEAEEQLRRKRRAARNRPGQEGLSESIHTIISRIEDRRLQEALDESRRLQQEEANDENRRPADNSAGADSDGKLHDAVQESELWVNKYRPKHFADLLSDGKANRDAVAWLKRWDAFVFGQYERRHPGKDNDDQGEKIPDPPLLLVSGPPGYGKTTLAHVAASHCGYRFIEVNASDERSGGAIEARIEAALETHSVTGDKRPACLILDEVDGLATSSDGKSAVDFIVKLAEASRKGISQEEDGTAAEGRGHEESAERGRKRKSAKKARRLIRPIMCICNDLYGPALRPLRGKAEVIKMGEPSKEVLLRRLRKIISCEGVSVDNNALHALIEKTNSDPRSCLHSLQFLSRRKRRITRTDVSEAAVGQKDARLQVFDAIRMVIGRRHSQQSWDDSFKAFQVSGDGDFITEGIFENLPNSKYGDVTMKKTQYALGWLTFGDIFTHKARSEQMWSLEQYRHVSSLGVRRQTTNTMYEPRVEFPKANAQARRDAASNRGILGTWLQAASARTQRSLSDHSRAAHETLPYLVDIINPRLQASAPHLLRATEKRRLSEVAGILREHGLTWNGSGELDPPLAALACLNYDPAQHRHCLPPALRQAAAHEASMSALRQAKGYADASCETTSFEGDEGISHGWARKRKSTEPLETAMVIRFKHNEGVTNAVRRPVHIRDLI